MIRCYAGNLGQGKTYSMVADALEQVQTKKCQIYTNMAGIKFPEAIAFQNIEQIQEVSHGLVLLDEAAIVVPSQFWQDVGRDFLTRLNQMRKFGLDMYYTAQRGSDGVNTNLRAVTNEVVTCSKNGSYLMQSRGHPTDKKQAGGLPKRFNPVVFALYDTLEVIKQSGESAGRPEVAALSTVARQREALARQRRSAAAGLTRRRPLLEEPLWAGWWCTQTHLRLCSEAKDALHWLKEEGYFDESRNWRGQVVAELKRRSWLAEFGYGPDDAPVWCTPATPWLDGHDPVSARLRWLQVEADRAAAALAAKIAAAAETAAVKSDAVSAAKLKVSTIKKEAV